MPPDSPDEPDRNEMEHRLDEIEEEIQHTRHEAREHGTIPGKHKPTFVDPGDDEGG